MKGGVACEGEGCARASGLPTGPLACDRHSFCTGLGLLGADTYNPYLTVLHINGYRPPLRPTPCPPRKPTNEPTNHTNQPTNHTNHTHTCQSAASGGGVEPGEGGSA